MTHPEIDKFLRHNLQAIELLLTDAREYRLPVERVERAREAAYALRRFGESVSEEAQAAYAEVSRLRERRAVQEVFE